MSALRAIRVTPRSLRAYLELRMREMSGEREKERAALDKMRAAIDQAVTDRIVSEEARLVVRARTAARRAARLLDVHQKAVAAQPLPAITDPKPAFSMASMRGPDPDRATKLAQIAKATVGRL